MCIEHNCISNARLSTLWLFIFFITCSVGTDPLADEWGITRIKAKRISYLWTITNYSLNGLKVGESLNSPVFPADDSNAKQWHLTLYPKNSRQSNRDMVSLFLYSTNNKDVTVSYQFYVINGFGEKTNLHSASDTIHSNSSGYGWDHFISQNDLQDKTKNLLPDDNLTILVEILVSEGLTNISGHCKFADKVSESNFTAQLLDSSFLSDVQLRVDGQVLKAHRTILAEHSSWFHEQFTKNPNLNSVSIENTTTAEIRQALRFMYTGTIENVESTAPDLLALSNRLGIEQLKLICEEVLCKSMKPTNATEILKLAELHDAKNLEREAAKLSSGSCQNLNNEVIAF